jgi:hypothetical protein
VGELHSGLCYRLDTRKPDDVFDELEQAKACHVIRLGEMPRTAFAGKEAMILIVQAISRKENSPQLISTLNRYLAGLHILSGGSMLPYDILLTSDVV